MTIKGKNNIDELTQGAERVDNDTAGGKAVLQSNAKIGAEEIRNATITLQKYKSGKSNLESRIIQNEEWWKLRHWEQIRTQDKGDPEPASAWLLNCILSKHADAMDSYPEGNFLPREANDKEEALTLSSIMPCVLDQNDFEDTYSDVWWYKLKNGTGVYGVFWDNHKLNGLGDISIRKIDLINLFWEPGITDIQESRNIYHVVLTDNDILEEAYPQLKDRLSSPTLKLSEYVHEDSIDTTNKSAVVDWYYKKNVGNGRTVLHYAKYVNDVVLFATENEEEFSESGLYDHGQYPFIFDVLFPEEGMPVGFGYIDVCKEPQKYIDLIKQCIIKNALMSSSPRYFIREDGSINEQEFADWKKSFVHTSGNLGEDSIKQIVVKPLDGINLSILDREIEEMKDTSGNRDVNNGGVTGGATAASAIAALQEQSGKLSRDAIKQSYRTFREILKMCIELIRQFYDLPRSYRITGQNGEEEFIKYRNTGLKPQMQGTDFEVDMGYRVPEFDIDISAQKASAYSKLSQNQLAMELFNAGFFRPDMADQSLACLDAMDFKGKELIVQKIQVNGTLFQQLQMMQQQILQLTQYIDALQGTNVAAGLSQAMGQSGQVPPPGNVNIEAAQKSAAPGEHPNVVKARVQAEEATKPR